MRIQIVLFESFAPLDIIALYEVLWAGGVASGSRERRELLPAEEARVCCGLRRSEAVGERIAGRLRPDQAEEGLEDPRGYGIVAIADHATALDDDSECDSHGITR